MVDLGGYIIILINHNDKIKLYGSPADNADTLEVADEILQVNGSTLENASQSEVIQYIYQCIESRTICLRVRRRSGNKMELDGFNAGRVREAWVIAVERRAKERLQRLASHWRIQPRDIQAILHQQINEAVASTSGDSAGKNVTGNQITVTLADKEPTTNAFTPKLSNGTIPKGIAKDTKDTREGKDAEKQQACPEETKLLVSGICVRFETNGKHETARLKFFRKRKKEKRRRRSEFELISLTNTNER
ncbi:uncharacterized protein LOC122533182 isoform X4 [Frieseomelitta varia]|uniref:uncharacterized protein LOC122533182 isoform X4 n=1 Tax=Frieseomelitta varia TaxID=561572 RepID=UPI001CB6ACA8|nr:uncharacterized protein LOC122533182 isoform X4 [Frieseomelitta varia]